MVDFAESPGAGYNVTTDGKVWWRGDEPMPPLAARSTATCSRSHTGKARRWDIADNQSRRAPVRFSFGFGLSYTHVEHFNVGSALPAWRRAGRHSTVHAPCGMSGRSPTRRSCSCTLRFHRAGEKFPIGDSPDSSGSGCSQVRRRSGLVQRSTGPISSPGALRNTPGWSRPVKVPG